MLSRRLKVGISLGGAVAAALTLFPTAAMADYAPTNNDVVGVGSDTLQLLGDFVADGDFLGDAGYNSAGNKNKFISIDATADGNVRLSYSPQGLGPNCAPGTGGTVGTGHDAVQHGDSPCVLNPTVVLRAGKSPQQRPNGSGAGFNLLKQDTNANGTGKGLIDFSRSSSKQGTNALFDSVQVGNDPFAILSATTTNAKPLSAQQLLSIYKDCTITNWNQVGGVNAPILPLMPQVNSGTIKSFEQSINNGSTFTPGNCVTFVEENDPEAIGASTDPINAIEPMSGGRLNLFLGKLSDGSSNGVGGYFTDPSCPFSPAESTTPAQCVGNAARLTPDVKYWTSGTPSDSNGIWDVTRPLYIYFRHADINSTKKFQPGSALNWVRTMLYNPCPTPGDPTCVTINGVEYGPGGQPYIASGPGQALISAAGIVPTYLYTASGP